MNTNKSFPLFWSSLKHLMLIQIRKRSLCICRCRALIFKLIRSFIVLSHVAKKACRSIKRDKGDSARSHVFKVQVAGVNNMFCSLEGAEI